jgi:hypothetical protein
VPSLVAILVSVAFASATPYPADNPPRCVTQGLTTSCDGPIQPDGTFKHCESTLLWMGYVWEPQTTCWIMRRGG